MRNCQSIIILHGWGSSKEKWKKVKENLEREGIEVIIPDIPGFLKETELQKPWALQDYLKWFCEFSKDKEKFFLLGHSFGGRISIKFAQKFPEKLKGLILVSAAGIKKKKRIISYFVPFLKKFWFLPGYNLLRKLFYKFVIRRSDYFQASNVMKETLKQVIQEDLTADLSQIKIKTLIIWGEKDKITPIKDAFLMKEKIQGSKLEILKKTTHTPYLECPDVLSQKIVNFIKETCES